MSIPGFDAKKSISGKLNNYISDYPGEVMSGVIPGAVQEQQYRPEQYLLRIALHSESKGTMNCNVTKPNIFHNYILKPGEWSSGMWVTPGEVVSYDCYCSSGGHSSGSAYNGMVLKCPM